MKFCLWQVDAVPFQHKRIPAGDDQVGFALGPIERGQERDEQIAGGRGQMMLVPAADQVLLKIIAIEDRRLFVQASAPTKQGFDLLIQLQILRFEDVQPGRDPLAVEQVAQFADQIACFEFAVQDD